VLEVTPGSLIGEDAEIASYTKVERFEDEFCKDSV